MAEQIDSGAEVAETCLNTSQMNASRSRHFSDTPRPSTDLAQIRVHYRQTLWIRRVCDIATRVKDVKDRREVKEMGWERGSGREISRNENP